MARNVNDRVRDFIVARQIDLIRAANGRARDLVEGPMRAVDHELIALIGDLDDPQALTILQRDGLVRRIGEVLGQQDEAIRAAVASYLDDVAGAELQAMEGLFDRTFGRIGVRFRRASAAAAAARARGVPMRGALVAEWVRTLLRNDKQRAQNQFVASVLDGQNSRMAAGAVVGSARQGFLNGIREVTRRGVHTLFQTLTTHAAGQARAELYDSNGELIERERWVATLDGKTSSICQALDGRTFPRGEGIHPPAHPRCRSGRMPIIPSLRALDVPGRDVLPSSVQEAYDGKGPQVLTYERWLRERSVRFQRRVLGKSRFELWRTGRISLDRFVNDQNKVLTLDELRRNVPDLFEEAGL